MNKNVLKKICKLMIIVLSLLLLTSCTSSKEKVTYSSYKELNGKNIAVWNGSIYESAIKEKIENPNIKYMDVLGDMIQAMREGKIDAVANSYTAYYLLKEEFPDIACIDDLDFQFEIGAIFAKDDKGTALRDKYNEFLKELEETGQLEIMKNDWVFAKAHTYEGLNEWDTSSGKLKVECGFSTPPYVYICDNVISGYEVALIAEFAKANHYEVEFVINDFAALITSVQAGMCDICVSGIENTKERAEEVNFSNPEYIDSVVFFCIDYDSATKEYNSIDELHNVKGGYLEGSICYELMDTYFADCTELSFNSLSDGITALKDKKIDFYLNDRSRAIKICNNIQGLSYIDESLLDEEIAFYTGKESVRQQKILEELNEFITNNKTQIDEITNKWLFDENAKSLDIELNENGEELIVGLNNECEPYCFVKDGETIGVEVDIIKLFAKEYGYNLKIEQYNNVGLMPAAISGKADICGGCKTITEERSQSVNFSKSYANDCVVAIVRTTNTKTNIFSSLLESFEKNFIREDRYKLILSGIYSTLKISILAILWGTLIGFLLYTLTRKVNKRLGNFLDYATSIVDGLPMIVILMILYYVIFSKSTLDGEIVSIIGFTFTFSLGVYGMLSTAVKSVDNGQIEAAYSLGFKDTRTFFSIVLPQALTQFMPNYKSAIVNLIKGTAVVGYIAVQDLTKASDMIRSRTYEAFFPLITTAIIYLLLGKILTFLINRIEFVVKPRKLTKEKILKKFEK